MSIALGTYVSPFVAPPLATHRTYLRGCPRRLAAICARVEERCAAIIQWRWSAICQSLDFRGRIALKRISKGLQHRQANRVARELRGDKDDVVLRDGRNVRRVKLHPLRDRLRLERCAPSLEPRACIHRCTHALLTGASWRQR